MGPYGPQPGLGPNPARAGISKRKDIELNLKNERIVFSGKTCIPGDRSRTHGQPLDRSGQLLYRSFCSDSLFVIKICMFRVFVGTCFTLWYNSEACGLILVV